MTPSTVEPAAEPAAEQPNTGDEQEKKRPYKFVPLPFDYHDELDVDIENMTDRGLGLAKVEIAACNMPPKQKKSGKRKKAGANGVVNLKKADPEVEANSERVMWDITVPDVIPGERVRIKVFRNYDDHSEADLVEVLKPSPSRVKPKCPLAGTCGGCQFQHMTIDAQRDWKRRYVREGLAKHGIVDIEESACLGTKETFGYRSKITPHYDHPNKARRSKRPTNEIIDGKKVIKAIGFQNATTRQILDVPHCPIGTPAVNAAFSRAREELIDKPPPGTKKKGVTLLFRQANLGDPFVETDNNAYITTKVGKLNFRYRAGNFFQNNYYVLPLMVENVVRHAIEGGGMTHLADCYCGSGLFALSASEHFQKVVGIEINDQAIAEATANAVANKITNCEFRAASAENIFEAIQDFPNDTTAVVLDPPRKGCSTDFLAQLYQFAPRKIVYMSCDPSTQARDAKGIVGAGYKITNVQPFDLFPQTRHIENLMIFERIKQPSS